MGTICAHPMEKDECNETVDTTKKNLVQVQGVLGENISIDIVLGHYRQYRSESLFVIMQGKNLQHCDPLKDYTNDYPKTIEMIQNMRKTFYKPPVHKACPYKKLLLCILPNYKSEQADDYRQLFCNVMREAFEGVKETTIEFVNTIQGVHTLPNQLIMGLLLRQLQGLRGTFKLNLISTEKKMMNFYRYQLMKTQKFQITEQKQ